MLQLLYGAYVVSEVQLLLLGSSLLFFSLFMSIGLISRMFEVTKSFGGAMIAFGVGLGIIYPLFVCINYGFLNVGMATNHGALDIANDATLFGGIIGLVGVGVFSALVGTALTQFNTFLTQLIQYIGLAVIGLTIIPVLNFILIDVFIRDFSKAVGEKMSFLSLFTRIV